MLSSEQVIPGISLSAPRPPPPRLLLPLTLASERATTTTGAPSRPLPSLGAGSNPREQQLSRRTVVERIAFCSAPPCPVLCFRESPRREEMTNK